MIIREWMALVAILTLCGCDNHKQGGSSSNSSNAAVKTASPVAPSSPDNFLSQFAGLLPAPDTVWLDLLPNQNCTTPDGLPGQLYYKPDSVTFPTTQNNLSITDQHPEPRIDATVSAAFKNAVVGDLAAPNLHLISFSNTEMVVGLVRCVQLDEAGLGPDLVYYTDNQGQHVRYIVRLGSLSLDRTEQISSYQAMRSPGYTSENRKYRILAQLRENPRFGTHTFRLERDVVFFFDAPNNVWQLDTSQSTDWLASQ